MILPRTRRDRYINIGGEQRKCVCVSAVREIRSFAFFNAEFERERIATDDVR